MTTDQRSVRTASRRGVWRFLLAPFSHRGLSGFALAGFFLLSVAATGMGFADLRAANTEAEQLSPLEIGLTIATTLFVVSAMVVALHAAIAASTPLWVRPFAFLFYLLFAVWTVGFGYGFFWKELAGQEFTERQFARVISDISGSVARTSSALATAEQATEEAASLAASRAETEAREGRTCANHPVSTPGEGPLVRSRQAFADRARNLGEEVRQRWTAPVAAQRLRLDRRMQALTRGAVPDVPPDSADADERAVLDQLAHAARLPAGERRTLFLGVHAEAKAFGEAANALRATHAEAFAQRLSQLAAEVGPDPARPGAADPARIADPGYCWDVVLNEKLQAAAAQLRALPDVSTPRFDFLEGPKATRAAFFGLVGWLAKAIGVDVKEDESFVFDDKAFLALFASIVVDLGILFLTVLREAPTARPRPPRKGRLARGLRDPAPPTLASILEPEI